MKKIFLLAFVFFVLLISCNTNSSSDNVASGNNGTDTSIETQSEQKGEAQGEAKSTDTSAFANENE